jgi:hypothetical protein
MKNVSLNNRRKKQLSITMVDFNFSINSLFPQEVNIVRNDLIPAGYQGQTAHPAVRSQVG